MSTITPANELFNYGLPFSTISGMLDQVPSGITYPDRPVRNIQNSTTNPSFPQTHSINAFYTRSIFSCADASGGELNIRSISNDMTRLSAPNDVSGTEDMFYATTSISQGWDEAFRSPAQERAIHLLDSYLRGDDERHHLESSDPSPEMLHSLPSAYEVTLLFGTRLLRCSHPSIRSLFCLGAHLLKNGIAEAVYLVRTKQVDDVYEFQNHLFRLSETPGVSNTTAATMERYRIQFLHAADIAVVDECPTTFSAAKSIAKKVRLTKLIAYCGEVQKIVDAIRVRQGGTGSNAEEEFLDIVRPFIRRMIRQCNIASIYNRLCAGTGIRAYTILEAELTSMAQTKIMAYP